MGLAYDATWINSLNSVKGFGTFASSLISEFSFILSGEDLRIASSSSNFSYEEFLTNALSFVSSG